MTPLEQLVQTLVQLGPVLILERYRSGELRRMGVERKVVTKDSMIAVLYGDPTQEEMLAAQKLLGAPLYREDHGLWYGVRRPGIVLAS